MKGVALESTLTCPICGHTETMLADACQFFYECKGCGTLLKPKSGECCVFGSYGTFKCPHSTVEILLRWLELAQLVHESTSLKEYFDSLHGYPKDNILLDAVTNAVERSYAKWNEDIFINWYGETRSWHSENTTPLHKVMDDYNELMCRVMEWCDSTTGDQKIVFPLEPVAVTPPVPVPWLSTTLLPPTISAPLPVAIKAELAST